ncbi:UDP-GlcNAc:betaGal beta-1,3-N-acetylglucosaminyltransferase 6-like [Stegastes partitus]|uniref:Hexosyltransferase n=1 Tax=Stegastes partitus TaxID=144197 RepID=A0A9Y4U1P3_9TELE|nr:PREDICTED: UDP-GlcNAc:betaGal beta-1,3-N-acetylglucosaminyltransferase 6-like [Stegastes partitus]
MCHILIEERMLQNKRHSTSKKKILITTLMVMGVLVVVVNLWVPEDLTNNKHTVLQEDVRKSLIQQKPATRSSSYKYSWPKCRTNISAASVPGFNSLPRLIQDFLYHRHCRHFPMILDVPDKCGGAEGSAEVFLLLVIKSSPGNYDRREVLRKTWAKERLQNGVWIRRLFIAGTAGDGFEKKRLNNLLDLEQHENNDILQWDFDDTCFLLSGYSALVMYNMSHSVMFHNIDDVFIALCMEKAGVRPTSHIGVKIAGHRSPGNIDPLEPCYFKEILLVHRFLPPELYVMWKRLHDPNLKCFHSNK